MTLWDQINEPVTYAIPFFLVALVVEVISLRDHDAKGRKGYEKTDARNSLVMGVVSLFFSGAGRVLALFGYSVLYVLSPFKLDPHSPLVWIGVVFGVDFLWYVYHRVSHRVRLVWAAHQVHHNSQYFNYATALRQKWNPWFELLAWTPLPALGVPPWMVFTGFSVNLIYQFWVHTETIGKLPRWFEFVFNTPSHHRVHHASDKEYLDKNFGGILILWDRLFGTFREESFRPTYGLTKNIDSTNVLTLQYHEFAALWRDVRSARTLRDRLGYLFGPPGWQPPAPVAVPEH
ncbi:sterol desaturase family protein [Amycolatopsis cynarae]|uniref:Sterol desaturase family protein n=1 Tax=Amycolatopsis cynarae TaxID=2995223 RepID=A0ABY7BA90_9PSEU|nr:sterol desaturase family protein [Amycolatopsis sp. HUAS 11-8]WAL68892.1 sterol desaturase family protein [Amycolatopsis sp. HUAS 11-8]